MSFDIETNEDFDDLDWPVTRGDCIILVAGYLLTLIGTGLSAAWIIAQIEHLIFKL